MLPIKAFAIAMILYSFVSTPWFGLASSTLDIAVQTVQYLFGFYVVANVGFGLLMLNPERWPLAIVQWTMVTSSLADGLFVAGMALLTGGLDSILFWLFIALIVRNAVSVPPGISQLILNFAISLCYILVAALDVSMVNNLDFATLRTLHLIPHENLGQPFVLRLLVLWLTMISCYGAQILLERQRLAMEEAEEFARREGQLRSAGRLAAEFAHQIKNPLAIINNAAYSLQRALRDGKTEASQQIEIIQEEVSRADRIVTEIMGYAQLTEGRVEKLDVVEELDRAIVQVFPPAVRAGVQVQCETARSFPPLLMQRRHFSEIVVNLLKNAREAVGETGRIQIIADRLPNHSVEITVRDNGRGISPDKIERIFEAYYTTKENGTGLGLAIVKHNVELYGGSVRVKSELGKGTAFVLTFPAKTLIKFGQ